MGSLNEVLQFTFELHRQRSNQERVGRKKYETRFFKIQNALVFF
jgi:hypothetical protein